MKVKAAAPAAEDADAAGGSRKKAAGGDRVGAGAKKKIALGKDMSNTKSQTLSNLLGVRTKTTGNAVAGNSNGVADEGELVEWDYFENAGEDNERKVMQKQHINGPVSYDMKPSKPAKLLGKAQSSDKYYVDEEDSSLVVDSTHPRAKEMSAAGCLRICIEGQNAMWAAGCGAA